MMLHTAKRRPSSDDAHPTEQHLDNITTTATTTTADTQQPRNLPSMVGSDSGYAGSSSSISSGGGGASLTATHGASPLSVSHHGESQKLSSKHCHPQPDDIRSAHRCGSDSMYSSSMSGSASGSASLDSLAGDHNSERGGSSAASAAWCSPSKVAQRRSDAAAAASALEPRCTAVVSCPRGTLAEERTPPQVPTLEAAATWAKPCQPAAKAAATANLADATSPRYSLIRKLGSGAMANVWLARDRIENDHKALKVITKKEYFEAGRREFAIGHRMRHPNLVPSLRCLQTPHKLVIVEHACSAELFSLVTATVGCDEARARRAMADVLCGLEYLHSNAGICHRDIKPEVCFTVCSQGGGFDDFDRIGTCHPF
jgi:hypothetical protein